MRVSNSEFRFAVTRPEDSLTAENAKLKSLPQVWLSGKLLL